MRGLGGKVELLACIEAQLHGLAGNEEALTGGLKCPVESSEELERVLSEDLLLGLLRLC